MIYVFQIKVADFQIHIFVRGLSEKLINSASMFFPDVRIAFYVEHERMIPSTVSMSREIVEYRLVLDRTNANKGNNILVKFRPINNLRGIYREFVPVAFRRLHIEQFINK